MYENAKYYISPSDAISIKVEVGGVIWFVPLDPANTDYHNIMQLVAEGKLTIAPAEGA
jgi:hypothetical protein